MTTPAFNNYDTMRRHAKEFPGENKIIVIFIHMI